MTYAKNKYVQIRNGLSRESWEYFGNKPFEGNTKDATQTPTKKYLDTPMSDTEYGAQGSMFYPDLPNKNICSDGCLLARSNMVFYRTLSLFLSHFLRKGINTSYEVKRKLNS